MSINRRYEFIKKMYPNTLIIFKRNNKCFSICFDKLIFNKFDKDINKIVKNNIDYIIIDNLIIYEHGFFENNNYLKTKKIVKIEEFIKRNLYL